MLLPISFAQVNKVYGGGGNPSVQDLPVCVAKNELNPEIPSEPRYVISKWKMTPEQLAEITENGGEIWMVTMGEGIAPMRLLSDNPFSAHGFEAIDLEAERQENADSNEEED